MFEQTNIKIIILTSLIIVFYSCGILTNEQTIKKQNEVSFEATLRNSILENTDTVDEECIEKIVQFNEGLYKTGKAYKHKSHFDKAWEEILPCMKKLKVASWYILFPDLKYVQPESLVLGPYYLIHVRADLRDNIVAYSFEFIDSLYSQGGPITIREAQWSH